jgi:hypothetical protein
MTKHRRLLLFSAEAFLKHKKLLLFSAEASFTKHKKLLLFSAEAFLYMTEHKRLLLFYTTIHKKPIFPYTETFLCAKATKLFTFAHNIAEQVIKRHFSEAFLPKQPLGNTNAMNECLCMQML